MIFFIYSERMISVWLQQSVLDYFPHRKLGFMLQVLGSQVSEIEAVFKTTTKTAQSLVKDSSSDVVNDMLKTLNDHKEVILKLRKELPDRSKTLKAILPNVESLETGIADLGRWLDQGEQLLQTHRLDGSGEATEARLERHKAYFSEITYQKSILESKNKVYQKVNSAKGKLKSVDFTPAEELMKSVNMRFQNCVTSAKNWEKRLENLARLWRLLQQKQNALSEWMDNAETVLEDKEDDPESLIRKHKLFFDRVNQKMLQDYLSVGEEILVQLEEQDKAGLKKEMTAIENRWKVRSRKSCQGMVEKGMSRDGEMNVMVWRKECHGLEEEMTGVEEGISWLGGRNIRGGERNVIGWKKECYGVEERMSGMEERMSG